ncbi:MAG: 7-cyano-7-deazaguanine synthase [Candidatus Thermoplasmatota archaeon]|nr:7-cyano-7-deazaguanine synthase [Candidatus Thermoplasmatota archaeon]
MRGVVLVSGGIDSPVAAYLMGRQGLELIMVHFDNRPFTSDQEVGKAMELMRKVDEALGARSTKILVPHGKAQAEFAKCCRRNMECVLCRRMMLRVAERIAGKHGAGFLVTGESLGQVASQTLANIYVEERATSLPVLRPLIGFDKIEIEKVAKRIGTYAVSIMPGLCCTIVPKKPSTYSRIAQAVDEETKIDLERLADEEFKGAVDVQ